MQGLWMAIELLNSMSHNKYIFMFRWEAITGALCIVGTSEH